MEFPLFLIALIHRENRFGWYNGILNNQLDQIGELSTQIAQIKNINRGDYVGYNLGFMANEKMKIAVLPIGYADGKDLGNGKLRFLYDKVSFQL